MSWPSVSDYQEAIQNPNLWIGFSDLRIGKLAIDPLGKPKVISSNSACVFQLNLLPQTLALRFFTKPLSNQERRYGLVGQYIKTNRLPGLLDCQYIPQALRVGNDSYPLVKMAWIEGDTLDRAIEESLNSSYKLLDLAAKWQNLITILQSSGFAHGDLEHRNVIITKENSIYLVDYDNAYVPQLKGNSSLELGNENFQHPTRTLNDYDEKIDSFSALVIYLSLRALAYQPNLWDQFYQGENLIFTKKDYLSPYQSSLFYQLKNSPDQTVRQISNFLENACLKPNASIGELGLIFKSFSMDLPQTSLNQNTSSIPQTRVDSFPLNLPSWQGTPSQINPTPTNPIAQEQINAQIPFPSAQNNQFNPLVQNQAQNQAQNIGINNQIPIAKPKSALWLKIFAAASSALAFLFFFTTIYLAYSSNKEISYLKSDVSYYSDLLAAEKEKTANLEKELAEEKELRTKDLLSKYKTTSATPNALDKVFFGSREIKRLNAKVDSVKFYEGGYSGTEKTLRVYSTTFTTASRFVYWELNLTHPSRPAKEAFTVQQVWYKDNIEWARGTMNTFLDPTWVNSYHNDGRGWSDPYQWSPGNYRLELFVDGEKIASGYFTVTP